MIDNKKDTSKKEKVIKDKNDIKVDDSNLTLDSEEERPGIGIEIFGVNPTP